jgi:MoxR-like ATPase
LRIAICDLRIAQRLEITVAFNADTQTRSFEEEALERLRSGRTRLLEELRRVIVGQDAVIDEIMLVLFTGSHCLITGAPGLAKTLLIRSIARILGLRFQRIQFTPDLMPSDITGTEIIDEERASGHRELRFIPGPVFTNILLADEINRTPPKTQAALLEAMEEKQVSVAGEPRVLDKPFYVLATQNPIELEGTYPLPEAQLDRFMLNIRIDYLSEDEELLVATRTTSDVHAEPKRVFTSEDMLDFARLVRMVPVAEPVARYAVRLVQASRPDNASAPAFIRDWVSWGAGTRGTQNLILAAKARALLQGRFHVACSDLRAVARPVLRHRILTNFRAEADGIDVEDIIGRLLEAIPEPKSNL